MPLTAIRATPGADFGPHQLEDAPAAGYCDRVCALPPSFGSQAYPWPGAAPCSATIRF